jgi:hypothetical protein
MGVEIMGYKLAASVLQGDSAAADCFYQRWDPSQSGYINFAPHNPTHAAVGAQQHFFHDSAAHPVWLV